MNVEDIRHLLTRSGFGPSPEEISVFNKHSRNEAAKRLVRGKRTRPSVSPPTWVNASPPAARMSKSLRKKTRQAGLQLQAWWFREMLTTRSPLTERMTLFWHNHFTSSLRSVKWPPLMYRQNLLLRQHGLGPFATLLSGICRDPAMLIYLNGTDNHKDAPNENFARELLELFTLGEGHYEEKDIVEAARAFTGYRVNTTTGEYRYAHSAHDKGNKTFLGRRGRHDGDAIVRILLQEPRTAEFVVDKVWRHFVSPEPDKRLVTAWAKRFREGGYRVDKLMVDVLSSDAFYAPSHRGSLIKSPVEFLVGLARSLDLEIEDTMVFVKASRSLGQELMAPPNVKGWPGYTQWITTTSLLERYDLARKAALSEVVSDRLERVSPKEWTRKMGTDDVRQALVKLLLPNVANPKPGRSVEQTLRICLEHPTFNLT